MGKSNWLTALVVTLAAMLVYGSIAAHSVGTGTHQPGTGSGPASAPASASPPGDSCPMAALRVTVATGATAAEAGATLLPVQFENVSASACTLPGYPAVGFAGGPKGPVLGPAAVHRGPGAAPVVGLAPGRVAHAWLQIAATDDYPVGRCQPVTAGGLSVSLGDPDAAVYVPATVTVCAHPPPGPAEFGVFPMQAGRATRGTAP